MLVRFISKGHLPILLIVFVVLGTWVSPFFLTARNVQNILITGSVVSVLAVGSFFVILTRGIDLSVGSVAALATVLVAGMLKGGLLPMVASVITLGICGLVGMFNGLLVVYTGITPFIVTLATMSIARGLAYILQIGTLITIDNQRFISVFAGQVGRIPVPVLLFIVVMIIAGIVARFTVYGRELYAIGGNPESARLSGLPVRRDLVSVYAISGFLSGLAGLMLAAQLQQGSSLIGMGYELDAIAAVVVGGASLFGGVGDPVSSVLGGLIIGVILNIMNLMGINSEPQLVIKGLVILIAVYFTSGDGIKRLGSLVQHQRPEARGLAGAKAVVEEKQEPVAGQ